MPHLTLQVSPGGPLVDVAVGVSRPREAALRAIGQAIPAPIQIRALLDTGASCTCMDPIILRNLGLTPTGVGAVYTPSTGLQPHQANQYDVSLTLLHPALNFSFFSIPVLESQLAIQGIQALIGRDLLRSCLFVYDGQAGIFTLAF